MSGRPAQLGASLRAAAATDAGPLRSRNEDRFLVDPQAGIFAVIDGVGGHAAGETAAELALQALTGRLRRRTGSPEERLREAVALANAEILTGALRRPERTGMGCVLTAAIVEDGVLTVAHVGDSRLYLLRGSSLTKLTRDHSPVGEREDAGEVGEREAMRHPRRNEVYRTVGSEPHGPDDAGFIDVVREPFGPGDALLLCTDGLTDAVTADEMMRLVARHADDAQVTAERLVEAAIEAGGEDNVTVVFAAGDGFRARGPEIPAAITKRAPVRAPAGPRAEAAASGWRAAPWLAFAGGIAATLLATMLLDAWRAGAPLGPPAPVEPAPARGAMTIRVGPGGFRTISEAMGAARPGDTVLLADGSYPEAVELPEGVTLRAEHPRAALIAPPRESPLPAVAIVADALGAGRIAGVRIEAGGGGLDTGILVRGSAVEIDDCEITGATRAGIEIVGTSGAIVRSSSIHDNPGVGILIGPLAAPRIAGNHVLRNGRRGVGPDIELGAGAKPELWGNVMTTRAAGAP